MKKVFLFLILLFLIGMTLAIETKEDDNYKVTFLIGSGITANYSDMRVSSVTGESGVGNYSDNWHLMEMGILYTIDTRSPIISNLRNTSTTNGSSFIEWNCSKACNYSVLWYNSTNLVGGINNNTFALSHNPYLGNLTNSTTYSINLTVWDQSGNPATNDTFSFTTATNAIEDSTEPTINNATVSPTMGAVGTIFNITVNATDDVEIDSVIAYVQKPDENNTATITLSLTNSLYNGTWDSSGKAEGTYVIDIVANDTTGNEKEKENGAVIALSSNANGTYSNSSVNVTSYVPTIINDTNITDTWLNITSKINKTTASFVITKYTENIQTVSAIGVSELGKYIDIVVDNDTNQNLSFAEIRVYYRDTEVSAANLRESTLRLYRFNATSSLWAPISPGGVNTDLNYVWGNVSKFSSFGIFGTEVSAPGRRIGGGGRVVRIPKGIGIGLIEERWLKLSRDSLDVYLVSGWTKTETLTITNQGEFKLTGDIDVKALKEYLSLSDDIFELEPDESKEITLDFAAKETGVQVGNIIFKVEDIEKIIPIILNIESEIVLFDVKIDIPAEYEGIMVGEDLLTQISLSSVGEPKKENVSISYMIKDLDNNIIFKEQETIAVENELSFVKTFNTRDLGSGQYAAVVEAAYADSIAITGDFFVIEEEPELLSPIKSSISSAIVITGLVLIIMWVMKKKRRS